MRILISVSLFKKLRGISYIINTMWARTSTRILKQYFINEPWNSKHFICSDRNLYYDEVAMNDVLTIAKRRTAYVIFQPTNLKTHSNVVDVKGSMLIYNHPKKRDDRSLPRNHPIRGRLQHPSFIHDTLLFLKDKFGVESKHD